MVKVENRQFNQVQPSLPAANQLLKHSQLTSNLSKQEDQFIIFFSVFPGSTFDFFPVFPGTNPQRFPSVLMDTFPGFPKRSYVQIFKFLPAF